MIVEGRIPDIDRCAEFRDFAKALGRGDIVIPPTLLGKRERRLHVRQTLREDHQFRIHNRPEGAEAKFDKLAGSVFHFFRGTALLYYRDQAGTDGHLPQVFTMGDAHPENFGVMPSVDGTPIFGVNDFDEAWKAPFSWDIKRCATGFWIVAKENGFKKKHRRKIVHAFVDGYLRAMVDYLRDDREDDFQFRLDNSPPMIRDLLEGAMQSRRKFLSKLIDLDRCRFIPDDEVVPVSSRIDEFQEIIDKYRRENEIGGVSRPDDFFIVRDVAIKKDSGTASLGLDRYFVLLEGWGDGDDRCVVLEMKQTRRSSLYGLVPENDFEAREQIDAIVTAHDVHLVGGDPFYGRAEIEGRSFLVRERSPFKDDIDSDDLDPGEMATYAGICGHALAHTHARSEGEHNHDDPPERRIMGSIEPEAFCADIVAFAHDAAKRIYKDHELFKRDHALGVFRFYHDS
ncbi:DUF2252 domain-containing protein [Stakelama marina]|uniref:DUF2252 family protein n=1 Tax=Stakelama marina TaxID=2826939 RepID=A0A8T4IBX3_9SPHN|nr:DUF2252 family protein [Stakelama marina]MBR0552157.1 DUF2252 family protein [Stakelama marina]